MALDCTSTVDEMKVAQDVGKELGMLNQYLRDILLAEPGPLDVVLILARVGIELRLEEVS